MLLDLFVFRADVEGSHFARTAGGLVESRQYVHRGGLSCAVGSQEAEYLATLHREAYVIDGME